MDVADDGKVEKMAIHLKVPETTLQSLKKQFQTDTPLLATKVPTHMHIDVYVRTIRHKAE